MNDTPTGGGGASIVMVVAVLAVVASLFAMIHISGRFSGPMMGRPGLMDTTTPAPS